MAVVSLDSSLKAVRKRASKPKTKSGCITCKLRHLKCDEGKPECLRCSKFGVMCEGYSSLPKSKPLRFVTPFVLAPKSETPPDAHVSTQSIPMSIVPMAPCQSEGEYQYFRFFQDVIAAELSSGFEATLWRRVVLQSCEDSSIRQLTLATAALGRATRASACPKEQLQHREYALKQYGTALQGVQLNLGTDERSLRLALIATLLIFVFESMHGDPKQAVTNIHLALELISHRIAQSISKEGTYSYNYPVSDSSRFPRQIEDEILRPFMRLDRPAITLLSRCNSPRSTRPRAFGSSVYLSDFTIPLEFASVDEARHCLDCIRFRNFPERMFESRLRASASLSEGESTPAILLVTLSSELAATGTAPYLRSQLALWYDAFKPIFSHASTIEGKSTFLATTILQTQATALYLPLHLIEDRPDLVANASGKILTLSKSLISHPQFTKGFVFECGIIPCLAFLVVLCPDLLLKNDAIECLRAMQPRVESVWDSRVVADAMERFVRDSPAG